MRITVFQHSTGTPPGSLIDWAKAKNHELDIRQLFAGADLPALSEVEWLIILGGPMNVDEIDKHPWLSAEKAFIKEVIETGRPCLGLCLGGQLLAQVLGASVTRHSHWEAGWHPVEFKSGEKLLVFQWHQDTFEIPKGAERIATGFTTENQAFTFKENVVGFQFHPEATEEWVKGRMTESPYPEGKFVQSPELLHEGLVYLPKMRTWFFELLSQMEARGCDNRTRGWNS